MSTLIDRIGRTREKWVKELNKCRLKLIDPPPIVPDIPYRMVLELDYLLVEAKLALEAINKPSKEVEKIMIMGAKTWIERCETHASEEVQNGVVYVSYLICELTRLKCEVAVKAGEARNLADTQEPA